MIDWSLPQGARMLLLLEGILIGLILGLTGAGGGILAVPALMATQGWTVAEAAPVALLAVAIASLLGALQGLKQGIVRYKAAIWIALLSIPMAHVGIQLATRVNPALLTLTFAIMMLFVAYRLFKRQLTEFEHAPCQVNPDTGKFIWTFKSASILGSIGLLAGLLTGLLGVGGGFVLVPALRQASNLKLHSIIATSLLIIFLVSSVSIALHVWDGFRYPLQTSLQFVLACVLGMVLGRSLIHRIPAQLVQRIFASLLLVVAAYLLWKSGMLFHFWQT